MEYPNTPSFLEQVTQSLENSCRATLNLESCHDASNSLKLALDTARNSKKVLLPPLALLNQESSRGI